jgi:hypothetical protein
LVRLRVELSEGEPVPARDDVPEAHAGAAAGATGWAAPGIIVFRIRDGLIVESRDYIDPFELARATNTVGTDFRITTSGSMTMRADGALHLVEPLGWNRRSCGNGSKGRRLYDWAWIATASERHHLLIRRKISDPSELAHHIAFALAHYVCSLTDLIKVAGTRWAIEDDFQQVRVLFSSIADAEVSAGCVHGLWGTGTLHRIRDVTYLAGRAQHSRVPGLGSSGQVSECG